MAIALGVAFVAGTLLLNASMNSSFYSSFAVGAQHVDVLVASAESGTPPGQAGGQTVPRPVLARVRAVRGVATADGRVIGSAAIIGSDGKVTGDGFGVNVTAADPSLSGFNLASGHLPQAADQVAIDKATFSDQHFRLGQVVRIVTSTGATRAVTLTGTVDIGVNPDIGNAAVLAFQTPVAFAVTGQSGYSMIVARAAPGVSQSALAGAITKAASGYEVQTGATFTDEEANAASHVSQTFGIGLLIFAAISLIVASIVIYNTFGILIAQRSREFALLRCVGASRRQVFRGMIGEAFAVGLAASVAGVLAGIGLAWVLGRVVTGASGVSAPLVLQPLAIVIAIATGLVVTVAASLFPARAATRIAPVAAVSGLSTVTVTRKTTWLRIGFAVLTGGTGLLLTFAGASGSAVKNGAGGGPHDLMLIAAGGCVFFLAVLALGPLISPPLISLFSWLPGKLARGLTRGRGTTITLATANARRNPHRVAATTAALTIGVTLITLFTVVFTSLEASTDMSIAGHYPFDYVVEAHGTQPVPAAIVKALAARPELAMVAVEYSQGASVDGSHRLVGAYSHNALGVAIKPAMISGALTAVGPGTAAVGGGFDVGVGGTITVRTPYRGAVTLRVVAVYDSTRYKTPMPDVLISTEDFVSGFRPAGAGAAVIDAAHAVSPARSRAAVDAAIASDPLLVANTLADYKANLNHQVNTILEMVGALLALAILIALFGISNTLTLSVIERTTESALLRALGLTRGQLRRTLLTEALLMAALAVLLGFALGIGFSAAMIHAFGRIGVLSVPYLRLLLYALAAGVAALAAAVLPARRAAKTSVITAITSLS